MSRVSATVEEIAAEARVPPPFATAGPRARWLGLAAVALAIACLFPLLGRHALYDPHESEYAEIAREMRAAGDWVTPKLNGAPCYDKPPLYFWLARAAFATLGETELATRLPNALAAAATVLLAFALGARLFGRAAGVAGALVLATSFGTAVFGRQLMLEELLCAAQGLAIYALFRAREAGESGAPASRWCALAGGAAGLAVLAKGLLGLVFPAAVALAMLVLPREKPCRSALLRGAPVGLAVMLAVAVPWHVAAQIENASFFRHFVLEEQVLRFLDLRPFRDYSPVPLSLFFAFAGVWLFPWTLFLPEAAGWAAREARRGGAEGRAAALLLAWAGAVLLFFALSKARLEYYSLPALLPLSILIGKRFADVGSGAEARAWPAAVASGLLVLAACAGLSTVPGLLARYAQFTPLPSVEGLLRWMFAALAAASVAALVPLALGRRGAAFATLVVGAAVLGLLVGHGFEIYAPARTSDALAAAVLANVRPLDAVVLDEPGEWESVAGLDWYMRARPDAPRPLVLNAAAKHVERIAVAPGERFLIDDADLAALVRGDRRVLLATARPDRFPRFRALGAAGRWTLLVFDGGRAP